MTGRATVYDVARAAGVSIKTVSRVVNNSEKVTDETRQRVLDAVADLDYVRNAAARSLRTGTADAIGIVVDSLSDPFFATLVSVVERRALAAGISVLVAATGRSGHRERTQVTRLTGENVCALLLAPAGDDHEYLAEAARNIPVVLVDRGWENSGYDTVRVHDRTGARMATDHLLAHGHTRIAFISDISELPTIAARRGGYTDALAAVGLTPDRALDRALAEDLDLIGATVDDLLGQPEPPSAIFASNPRAGLGVARALHRSGRTDVALVSFGDFPLADSLTPAVTVIDQDPTLIATAAADRLLARIQGQTPLAAEIVLPLTLIPRGSGEVGPCSRS
jgi:LacI family transcriptional regulator